MRWQTPALIAGSVLAGALFVYGGMRLGLLTPTLSTMITRDIVAVEAMSARAAARHRDNGYADLHDIASLQALPTEFDRAEALYALCGRADSGALQALAWEALRVADTAWRERALSIVFFRLAELDPRTALVLAGQAPFTSMRSLEARVLRTWARYDLDAAVAEVTDFDDARQKAAIETIYRALESPYGEAATRVETMTGIAPGGGARAAYLLRLAATDPEDAFAHVLALEEDADRRQQARNLGTHLARENGRDAEAFAERFADDLRLDFLAAVYRELAKEEPDYAFEQRFASRDAGALSESERDYLEKLAGRDLDRALRIAAASEDPGTRVAIAEAIAAAYGRERPRDALAWAAEIPDDDVLLAVIRNAGAAAPAAALDAALAAGGDTQRQRRLLNAVVASAGSEDPARLAPLLTRIDDDSLRRTTSRTLAKAWLDTDAVAAVDWLLGGDAGLQQLVFQDRRALDQVDLDTAQVVVGMLPAAERRQWNNTVVRRLVQERSPADALNYLSQYTGQPGYVAELSMLVTTVAESDRALAMQWLERIPDGTMRDAALANVVGRAARNDPQWAAARVTEIADADLRAAATTDVLNRWRVDDPAAAREFLGAMPRGPARDSVVLGIAMDSHRDRAEQTRLIESIDDSELRRQALLLRDMMQSRSDPEELIRQLDAIEMPAIFRQQMKAEILRSAARGY